MENDSFERRNAARIFVTLPTLDLPPDRNLVWDSESLISVPPHNATRSTIAENGNLIDFGSEVEGVATSDRVPSRSVRFESVKIVEHERAFQTVNNRRSRSTLPTSPASRPDTGTSTSAPQLQGPRHNGSDLRQAQQQGGWRGARGWGRGRGRGGRVGPNFRHLVERPSPRAVWAGPPKLVTTKQAEDDSKRALAEQRKNKYLLAPEDEEDFIGIGFYLWPLKDDTPMDLLGLDLEELNAIRVTHKIHIVWDDFRHCLKICSKSVSRSEAHILAGVRGIRLAVEHAKARAISCSPVYIITPPTASGMKTIVQPGVVEGGIAKSLKLAGEELSSKEKAVWKENRPNLKKANYRRLSEALVRSLLQLAPYKGWMRLRVHFGHVFFKKYRKEFAELKSSFENFTQMMGLSRTTAQLERRLEDATVALKLQEMMNDWPIRFCSIKGPVVEGDDVQFKDRRDTEVIFITTMSDKKLRIEVDIDRNYEGGAIEYQVGCTKLYKDDTRNKRVEITTIDVEKQVDWSFEVVADNSIPELDWPSQIVTLTKQSISSKTGTRYDPLGLPFAGVSPVAPYGIQITSVVVRSVKQYKIQDSGYIVDIAVYRTWDGDNLSTVPTMAASTSLFHPSWDLEMDTVEHSTKERLWNKELSQFLDQGSTPETRGLQALLDEIEVIQGFLSSTRSTKGGETASD